jgi:hypothetical protein
MGRGLPIGGRVGNRERSIHIRARVRAGPFRQFRFFASADHGFVAVLEKPARERLCNRPRTKNANFHVSPC